MEACYFYLILLMLLWRIFCKKFYRLLAGAVDEEIFLKLFEDVPTIQLFSHREVNDHMKSILDTISDPNKDWNKRVDAVI